VSHGAGGQVNRAGAVDALPLHMTLWQRVDPRSPPADIARLLADASAAPFSDRDTHTDFVRRLDGPQHGDEARAARYLEALARVRRLADEGRSLTWEVAAAIQGVVLGLDGPAEVRSGEAFARGGEHRYACLPDLQERFAARLALWDAADVDPVVAACGVYLDIIFLHPFVDGNARAARLAYELLLRRARRPVPRLEDLLRLRKRPGDADDFWRLVRLSAASIAGLARRCPHGERTGDGARPVPDDAGGGPSR